MYATIKKKGEYMDSSLGGTVETVIYKNKNTGFCVFDLAVKGELVTVVGELPELCEGEQVTVWGEFVTHKNFGRQFKAVAAERVLPRTATAIQKYLESGAIEGVGKVTAQRLVEAFSDNTLEVIARQPERLSEIKGISKQKAIDIHERFRRLYGMRETLAALGGFGLDMGDSLELYKSYADIAPAVIADNPYMLCGYPLYKEFSFADAIAAERGVPHDDPKRVLAGFVYVLRHNLTNGHCCLPCEKLLDITHDFLEIDRDTAEIQLFSFTDGRFLRLCDIGGQERVFLPEYYLAERYISERIRLARELSWEDEGEVEQEIKQLEERRGIEYAPLQLEAIIAAFCSGAVVITGGPGTGKTTTVNAIIGLCELHGDKVMLAAPTGRAAKRLSELAGHEAKTIHRLLEMDFAADGSLKFVHDEENKLACDLLVVDEMSMTDSKLMSALLRATPEHARIVMVGDSDQLPAVGAGNVLRDIVDSGVCRVVELSHIFRQAAQSLIVTNAHRIVGGELPDLTRRDADFFFIEGSGDAAAELMVSLATARLPKKYGFDPVSDIQLLTPTRLGALGTVSLNDAVRERVNPREDEKGEITIMGNLLRVGDKVMQTKNNYDIKYVRESGETGVGVFNGDIGSVTAVDLKSQLVVVRFDDRAVAYTFEQARQLEPAYAVTVHKSQGSEFECVVLALSGVSKRLMYRNLLYTAATRARRLLVIVGERAVMERMIENDKKQLRYTGLKHFLCETGEFELL